LSRYVTRARQATRAARRIRLTDARTSHILKACFDAPAKFQPQGDGWPAFHGNSSNVNSTVCTPGGTEVVCSKCGSHLGDYFAAGVQSSYSYYCIDGVCLLPPGAEAGKVCEPAPALPTPSKAEAYSALRALMREKGAAAVLGQIDNHDDH
jgi:peptide methionine sulfoxide reductase MsrB